MLKYFTSILIMLLSVVVYGQDASDDEDSGKSPVVDSCHQLRLGFDLTRLLYNQLQKDLQKRTSYAFELDYYTKKDLYLVAEGGWGNASISYPDLSYNNRNVFVKLGVNKSLLPRMKTDDWDLAFVGIRYGVGVIHRSNANYTITDSTWGVASGSVPAQNVNAHWIELTGGVRVEVVRQVFLGWNIRGKFMVNAGKFNELPPYYIAGYGKGEKKSIFDFNMYLCYAIRWARKHPVK